MELSTFHRAIDHLWAQLDSMSSMGTAGSERRKRWRHKACRRLQARAVMRNVAETLKQARRDPSDESLERLRGALLMIERAAAASPKLDAAAQNCAGPTPWRSSSAGGRRRAR